MPARVCLQPPDKAGETQKWRGLEWVGPEAGSFVLPRQGERHVADDSLFLQLQRQSLATGGRGTLRRATRGPVEGRNKQKWGGGSMDFVFGSVPDVGKHKSQEGWCLGAQP